MNWPAIALLLIGLSAAGGFWFGADWKANAIAADVQREQEAHMVALNLVADELGRIKVVQKNTTQVLEREIVEKVVYRDCKHSPEALKALNDALVPGGAK